MTPVKSKFDALIGEALDWRAQVEQAAERRQETPPAALRPLPVPTRRLDTAQALRTSALVLVFLAACGVLLFLHSMLVNEASHMRVAPLQPLARAWRTHPAHAPSHVPAASAPPQVPPELRRGDLPQAHSDHAVPALSPAVTAHPTDSTRAPSIQDM